MTAETLPAWNAINPMDLVTKGHVLVVGALRSHIMPLVLNRSIACRLSNAVVIAAGITALVKYKRYDM